jgi:hypothetical protein
VSVLRLYFDEDTMDWDVIHALRSRDVEIASPSEAGLLNANDETQLSFATSRGYAIYTFNVGDYCRLHAEWLRAGREHAGIIIGAQQKFSVGEQVRRILRLRAEMSGAAMRSQLEYLSRWG